jgi:hypothetical protein
MLFICIGCSLVGSSNRPKRFDTAFLVLAFDELGDDVGCGVKELRECDGMRDWHEIFCEFKLVLIPM